MRLAMKNKIIERIENADEDFEIQITNEKGDIMSVALKDVITATPSTPIINVANLMTKNNIRRVPITEPGSGKILGIITTMDILDFFGGGKRYNIITEKYNGNFLSAINAPIREIMTKDVKTMSYKDTIIDAASVMIKDKIGGLPIIDDDEQIIGMITEGDVVSKLKELIFGREARDLMTDNIITTTPGTRIEGVTKIMVRNSLRRIPIVGEDPNSNSKEEKILGVVTASDVLKYLGDHELFAKLFSNEGNDVVDVTIDNLMEDFLITAPMYEKTEDLIDLMKKFSIKGIPIVDEDTNKLVGIVTVRDLLKAIVE
ncbi:hypothetical protein ASJ82_03330 [Methanosphaera cuniculi]|uniref:CBS domain-containing protein n=2 Tax=Methanosphaera cuniculi TaxID=1077256 RepID=A0A2A2HG95_9EURY|nr:hypothetical protein ASJ82_03330 [Methanosphaera cuniculi]